MAYSLGRKPSPPDSRDFHLGEFLGTDADLRDKAVGLLKQTTRGYKDVRYPAPPAASSFWGKGLALLAQIDKPPPPPPSKDVVWSDPEKVLDQGDYGTCVGNGFAQWGNTLPVDDKYTEGMGQSAKTKGPYARAIYYEATVIDGSPDDPNAAGGGQEGATVRAGVKAMQNRKRLSAYAFAANVDEIKTFVNAKGPVVVGTDWTEDMFTPSSTGFVKPTGQVAGGHCYLILGNLVSESAFYLLNSWGTSWGLKGYFKMKWSDFAKLLDAQGEAVAAVEL